MVGGRIDNLRIPFLKRHDPERDSGFWSRWSRHVQRHPWTAAIASGALLLALCTPTLALRLGSSDAGSDPSGTTTRKAYDLLARGFGPGFNGPLQLVAELPAEGGKAALAEIGSAVEGRPGVASVSPPPDQPRRGRRRDRPLPDDLAAERRHHRPAEESSRRRHAAGREPRPARSSTSAVDRDLRGLRQGSLASKLPLFIGVVVLLSALLLMAVFRSVLVPLKAVVMNLLSIGAAFGVVVAVFQWGWLGSADRGRPNRPDRVVPAGDAVRDRLRTLDGLRGLPDVAHPRGVGQGPRCLGRGDQGPRRRPAA